MGEREDQSKQKAWKILKNWCTRNVYWLVVGIIVWRFVRALVRSCEVFENGKRRRGATLTRRYPGQRRNRKETRAAAHVTRHDEQTVELKVAAFEPGRVCINNVCVVNESRSRLLLFHGRSRVSTAARSRAFKRTPQVFDHLVKCLYS